MNDINVSYLFGDSRWGVTIEELLEGNSWMMLKK
jgi:hypothetical protein